MLEHVWRRTTFAIPEIETVIITDSDKIVELCKTLGANYLLTSKSHNNALSRIGEASKKLNWDFYIVVQADEILIDPESLKELYYSINLDSTKSFFNLVTPLKSFKEVQDRNTVKCLLNAHGFIMYIFRKSPLVSEKSIQLALIKKISGIYAISSKSLKLTLESQLQPLENSESIEQLKILELDMQIIAVSVARNYPSVNTKADARAVRTIIKNDPYQKSILSSILT
jgi:3-deoxy-manno-octulosonate cytidylyltransferase (CMP-KDO synthetase)